MDKVYKALSDGTRRKIMQLLRERDMTAGEIAAHFDLTKPTLSAHFAVLREAGLVQNTKNGRNVTYRLNAELLERALNALLQDYSFVWAPPEDIESVAQRIVESLVRRDFTLVAQDFDQDMAAALPEGKLASAWDRTIEMFGPFVKALESRVTQHWKDTTVTVTCEFAQAQLDIHVKYARTGQISGLLILGR